MLALDGQNIVSHYAVSPFELIENGKKSLSALSCTTMTHPEYQGRGLFPILAKKLFSSLKEQGFCSVLSFPNIKSHRTFIEKLNWSDIGVIHSLKLEKNKYRHVSSKYPKISTVNKIENLFSNYSLLKNSNNISLSFSPEYIKWRYSRRSGNVYKAVQAKNNSELVEGFIIYKIFNDQMIDLVYIGGTTEAISNLINFIVEKETTSEIKELNTWANLYDHKHLILEKIGFSLSSPITFFSGLGLKKDYNLPKIDKFDISMTISDVY